MGFVHSFDTGILTWRQQFWGSWLDAAMNDFTAVGGFYVLSLVTLFAVGLLVALRRYQTAGFLIVAILGGVLLSRAFKTVVARPRPNAEFVHKILKDFPQLSQSHSFPSGHSMLSAVTYMTLALVATTIIPRRRARVFLIVATLLLVFLIGASRVYLGAHHPTDVLGGWTVGLVWALGCRWVAGRWVLPAENKGADSEHPMEPTPN